MMVLFMVMLFTNVVFTSCDDDNDVPTGNSSIVGSWELGEEVRVNGHKGTLTLEFNSNKKGKIEVHYTDGTDGDTCNFEYVIKEQEGDTYLTIIWTGTQELIYQQNKEYRVIITPTRFTWGSYTYVKK